MIEAEAASGVEPSRNGVGVIESIVAHEPHDAAKLPIVFTLPPTNIIPEFLDRDDAAKATQVAGNVVEEAHLVLQGCTPALSDTKPRKTPGKRIGNIRPKLCVVLRDKTAAIVQQLRSNGLA